MCLRQVWKTAIPEHLIRSAPEVPFCIGRSAIEQTVELLHLLLDHCGDLRMFFAVAELCAKGQVPESIQAAVKLGLMTALSKPEVRGIVAGDALIGGQNDVAAIDGGCVVDHISFFRTREPQRNNSLRGWIERIMTRMTKFTLK